MGDALQTTSKGDASNQATEADPTPLELNLLSYAIYSNPLLLPPVDSDKASQSLLLDGTLPVLALQPVELLVGMDLSNPPSASRWTRKDVPQSLGCASTVSNLCLILLKDFTVEDFQINVDGLEQKLINKFAAQRLDSTQTPQEGDFVIGRGNGRHAAMVRSADEGGVTVYHNRKGELMAEPLAYRFKNDEMPEYNYPEVYFLRIPELKTCGE